MNIQSTILSHRPRPEAQISVSNSLLITGVVACAIVALIGGLTANPTSSTGRIMLFSGIVGGGLLLAGKLCWITHRNFASLGAVEQQDRSRQADVLFKAPIVGLMARQQLVSKGSEKLSDRLGAIKAKSLIAGMEASVEYLVGTRRSYVVHGLSDEETMTHLTKAQAQVNEDAASLRKLFPDGFSKEAEKAALEQATREYEIIVNQHSAERK
jgi:hypothetical protein